jgi:glutathione S-transferase
MKLYWAPHTRSFTALWALHEAGVAYDRERIDIRAGAQDAPAYRAINPMGKVPALVDEGVVVTETAAICAYVADRVPSPQLAPLEGSPARGAYYRWMFFGPSCIEPALTQKRTGLEVPKSTAGWGSFDLVMDTLEGATAAAEPWLLGERFTMADVVIGAALHFGVAFGMVEPRPAFTAYVERCQARPAFQTAQTIDADGS